VLKLFVEGEADSVIVNGILNRLQIRPEEYEIAVMRGHLHPTRLSQRTRAMLGNAIPPVIIVYDQDSGTIADAPAENYTIKGHTWCPAIPQIEGWLFADEQILRRYVPQGSWDVVARLPSPESIPYPKVLRGNLLREPGSISSILREFDVERAAARSPSLANFLRQIQRQTNRRVTFDSVDVGASQIDKAIVVNLISEVYPSSDVIYRTSDGRTLSAEQMIGEVTAGSPLGREYSSEVLRVARDLLRRQAQRESRAKE